MSDLSQIPELNTIQNPLTLILPLKEGTTPEMMQEFLIRVLPTNMSALLEVGSVHFLRIFLIDNNTKAVFMTEYDGSFEKYCIDFAVTLGTGFFEPLFAEFTDDPPTFPVADNIQEFTDYIDKYNQQSLLFYAAYPQTTVQDIWFEFDMV